jgi:hypothetical protein
MRVLAIALVLLGTTFAQIASLGPIDLAIAGGVHGITDVNDLATWSEASLTHTYSPGALLIDGEVSDDYIENTAAWLDDVYPWFDVEIPTVTSSDGSTTYDTNGIDDEYFYFNGGEVRDTMFLASANGKMTTFYGKGSDSTNERMDATIHTSDVTTAYPRVASFYFTDRTTASFSTGIMVSLCGFTASVSGVPVFASDGTGSWSFVAAANTDADLYSVTYVGASPFAVVWQNFVTESFYDGDDTVNSNELRFQMTVPAALVGAISSFSPTITVCFSGSGLTLAEEEAILTEKKENDALVGWTYADSTESYKAYFSPDHVARIDRGNITDVALTFTSSGEGMMSVSFPIMAGDGDITLGGAVGIYKEPIVTETGSTASTGTTASTATSSGSSFTSLSLFSGVLVALIALLFN